VVVVLLVLVYAGASWFVYDQVGRAPRACWPRDRDNTPVTFTVPVNVDPTLAERYAMPEPQEVRFASRDPQIPDAELAAWWIPAARADAPAVVLVHGVQSCRREANVLIPAGMLHQAGFSVFLMDLRDHGDSEGDDARFAGGSEEYLDVLGGWDWVRAQGVPAERIGLLGVSFGAANTIIAGGQEPAVAAVWADSSPTMMEEAIGLFLASQLKDSTGMSKILVPGSLIWARILAGDDLTRMNPIEQVDGYAGRSIAFVHGAADPILPARFAGDLHDRAVAAGAAVPDPWIVPNAGHTEGVYNDPDGYRQRLVDFFTGVLGEP
jgi:fermentation-respiration switch protein FrsA (DUF1100 family)